MQPSREAFASSASDIVVAVVRRRNRHGAKGRHGRRGLFEEETATAPRAATGAKGLFIVLLSHRARDYAVPFERQFAVNVKYKGH
jgi:hypothetical protein